VQKLNFVAIAVIAVVLQAAPEGQASNDPALKTNQLLDSKGHVFAKETVKETKAHTYSRRRVRSTYSRSNMVQTIHQAARRPGYAYRTR
jgi:hypothetical protein